MRRFFPRHRQDEPDHDRPDTRRRRRISSFLADRISPTTHIVTDDQLSNAAPGQLVPPLDDRALAALNSSDGSPTALEVSQVAHTGLRPSYTTISRSVSAQSTSVNQIHDIQETSADAASNEEGLPRTAEVAELQNIQITRITASPMPPRSTILSRLGSLISQRSRRQEPPTASVIGDSDSLHLTRRRLSRSLPSRRGNDGTAPHGFSSVIEAFSHAASPIPLRSRRRRDLSSISRPIPISTDAISDGVNVNPISATSPHPDTTIHPDVPSSSSGSYPRSRRLSRIRNSIIMPFENLLSSQDHLRSPNEMRISPPRPARNSQSSVLPNYTLPPLSVTDPHIDLTQSSQDEVTSPANAQGNQDIPTSAELPELPSTRTENVSWAERLVDRASAGRREARRVPNMLRGRSSRLIRREDEGPLPRILQLAAATIAAQLSGNPNQALGNLQAIGNDGVDGNINNVFRSLQNAASGRPSEDNIMSNGRPATTSTLPPLNFVRVFRFVNGNSRATGHVPARNISTAIQPEPNLEADSTAPEGTDGRIVTLVMVGVRSVPSDHIGDDAMAAEPTLDAFLRLPHAMTNNLFRSSTGGFLRHADGRSRFPRRRRASMGGINTFPANYDSQRHQRLPNSFRHSSITTAPNLPLANPSTPGESPPGPHPPPSTPADPYLSGSTTPSRRPSSASALHPPPLPSRELAAQHLREAGIPTVGEGGSPGAHQRRRSDSEFARHRDLGTGSARRHGVVEPDIPGPGPGDTRTTASRSWLIYVIGTNLSEDHPALTTPTLFTDVRMLHTRECFQS